ncbi:MAG: hypothetical protein WC022_03995 [Parcubacteria group bacterium]
MEKESKMAKTGISMMATLAAGNVSSSENRKSFQLLRTEEASVRSRRIRIQKSDCKKACPYSKTVQMKTPSDPAKLKYDHSKFSLARLSRKAPILTMIKSDSSDDGSVVLMLLNI